MGRNKAALMIGGQQLWQRQLEKLRALEPAELFISGRPGGPFASAGVEIVTDAVPDLGPLSGIAAALRRTAAPLLLVLAVDLPGIRPAFLRLLIEEARTRGHGVVPQAVRGFEPLAAVYPSAALPLAEDALKEPDRSLQTFVQRLVATGLASTFPLAPEQLVEFYNLNEPADLSRHPM
jgi:molybdopterin-guanine dinucleotide biosynthesis protein A